MTLNGRLEFPGRGHVDVVSQLGVGAQGAVYQVRSGGEDLALKWYHTRTATESQRHAIAGLAKRGAPDDRFVWPLEVLEHRDLGGFGYLMRLRPANYPHLGQLLRDEVDPACRTYSFVATLGRELADTFLSLHGLGLCYRDLNFTNVAFDPATATPCIMDTDNIGVDRESVSAVKGSRKFMAPEIVVDKAMPSIETDLWSMAVMLFYILMGDHPLHGRRELDVGCMNSEAESVLYGREPVFVLHPDDDSNAPLPGEHDNVLANWELYPDYVRELFVQTFTAGVDDPSARARESEWRKALTRLGDSIGECHRCGAELVVSYDDLTRPCWACRAPQVAPLVLRVDGRPVVLHERRRLYEHHLRRSYTFRQPFAEVARHPERADRWGLTNTGTSAWTVTVPDGSQHTIEPGATVALVRDCRFDFGSVEGHLSPL